MGGGEEQTGFLEGGAKNPSLVAYTFNSRAAVARVFVNVVARSTAVCIGTVNLRYTSRPTSKTPPKKERQENAASTPHTSVPRNQTPPRTIPRAPHTRQSNVHFVSCSATSLISFAVGAALGARVFVGIVFGAGGVHAGSGRAWLFPAAPLSTRKACWNAVAGGVHSFQNTKQ